MAATTSSSGSVCRNSRGWVVVTERINRWWEN
jgi:hypothetical protein